MFRRVSRCARGSGLGWRVCPTRGDSARTGRILGRHKNGEYAAVTRGRPAFQRHEAHAEGSDTTPMQKCRKNAKREFLSPPPTGLPRIRRPLGRRPASHLSGLRRSRCPAKCTERTKPCTQIPGRSPDPLKAMIGEKHEKRYQIQHAHGVRRP